MTIEQAKQLAGTGQWVYASTPACFYTGLITSVEEYTLRVFDIADEQHRVYVQLDNGLTTMFKAEQLHLMADLLK